MSAPRLRVVIADDEPLMRHALQLALDGTEGVSVVAVVADAAAAVQACEEQRPDVVLLDHSLALNGNCGDLAGRAGTVVIFAGRDSGPWPGYAVIPKTIEPTDLAAAVRNAAAGAGP